MKLLFDYFAFICLLQINHVTARPRMHSRNVPKCLLFLQPSNTQTKVIVRPSSKNSLQTFSCTDKR